VDWLEFKTYLSQLTVSKDALHIYAALIVQVAAALIVRVPLSSLLPWSAVLIVEIINEGLDLLLEKEPYIHRWQIDGSIHDLVNTMAIPTALMLLVRYSPWLFMASVQPAQEPDASPDPE
jgi:hypothetical protein